MNEDPRGEPGLFDLPLDAPPPMDPESVGEPEADRSASDAPPPRRRAARAAARPETLPLFDLETRPEPSRPGDARPRAAPERSEPAGFAAERLRATGRRAGPTALPAPPALERPAPLAARLQGTGGDLVIVAATGAVAALGARWLGARIGLAELAPLTLFLLAWSFVYFVVPLAFWGATPGMSWAGLIARTSATEPLSFGQAAMRWLGTWLTWATLGVGGLVALTGRSLADRLSGSSTFPDREPDAAALGARS